MTTQVITNREAWLSAALTRISKGWPTRTELPENTRVSVGFPVKNRGRGAGRVTEHHAASESEGGFVEIFVSPTMGDARTVARALALEAATVAMNRAPAGEEVAALIARADAVVATLPEYPHDAMSTSGRGSARVGSSNVRASAIGGTDAAPAPAPGSRLIKVHCGECGYTMRVTRTWILQAVPVCPICHPTMAPAMTVGG